MDTKTSQQDNKCPIVPPSVGRRFYVELLAASLLAGFLAALAGELLFYYGDLGYSLAQNTAEFFVSQIVLVATYVGISLVLLGALVAVCEGRRNYLNWDKPKPTSTGLMIAKIPVVVIALALLAGTLQYLYSLGTEEQKPADDYILLIDNSGSMGGSDPNAMRYVAADDLIDKLDADNGFSAYVFTDIALQVSPFRMMDDQNKQSARSTLSAINANGGGGTVITSGVEKVMQDLGSAVGQDRNVKLLLLSDGLDGSAEKLFAKDGVLKEYREKGIAIDTIILGDRSGMRLMQKIAHETGGSSVFIRDADNLTNAYDLLSQQSETRNLLKPRFGELSSSWFYAFLRVLFVTLLGIAISFAAAFILGAFQIWKSALLKGIVCGILAGLILECGFASDLFDPSLVRLVAIIVLLIVLAWHLKLIFPPSPGLFTYKKEPPKGKAAL